MTGSGLSRRDAVGLGAVAIGAAGLGAWLRRGVPLGEDISGSLDVAELAGAPGFPVEGPQDAPVTMLVFSDYACGVCRQVEPWWRAALRKAGDVRAVHRDWPILGPDSRRAARIALAADRQGRYLAVHDALMGGAGPDMGAARGALERAGGDWARLEADLADHAGAIDALLARTTQDALRLGFNGTPGFLIGPIRILGGASERQFANAIERARGAR